MSLDGFSMHPLTRELHTALAGGRIDKITQPNKQSIILSVRQPGQNFLLHISINSQNPSAHLLEKNLENPPEPPVFCMVLRKQIETGRIAQVRQHGLDRLLLIDIDSLAAGGRIVTKTLVLELMGKYSNIILVQDGIIIDALRKIGANSSRVRTVLPGQTYELPPGQEKKDLFTDDSAAIMAIVRKDPALRLDKALLAACMGFGPVSAKEVCFSAGLAPSMRIEALDEADFKAVENALQEIRESALHAGDASAPEDKAVLLLGENQKVLAMAAFPLHYLPEAAVLTFPTISAMLEKADSLLGSYVLPDKDRFRKLVKNEKNRAENKLTKLDEEIAAAENAEEFKVRGDNLMTYQYQFKDREDASVTVPNIYSETGETITIPLDQRLTLVENMQACYKKYDKLKRAQELLQVQRRECEANIAYLESIEASLLASSSLAEIAEIHNELIAAGYLREKPKKKNNDKPARPFHFRAPDGTDILVGKNNYQNDKLTFKTARYNDTWFHTKDIPGSHVVLQNGGTEPSEEDILIAASLAAHFSKARGSSKIPVDYTEIRYVKKPSGSKPGFVIFTNQKTLYITPDEAKLAPILAQDPS
ncbi:Rqc2 family fibronectin-binding protein [Mitsuokella multacida]|uniref:Rqc2 homolog RqcH n=1 Tax=Mitsuokella multacida DSM 20544 TaxID=500635 RepID=C9KKR7_9FIRM|nr:NFACT family protein [Mitsuokella multacida]EEX69717.1 fibronectin-binding protein A domain protein [Mitsuokella multacida DSM 20544]